MAKIYPERLPESVAEDPKRSAEIKVFTALKTLPNKYKVFYSVHWQSDPDHWGIKEGEADFVVAHPDMGVLTIEVKGGGIRFDADRGQWYSHDRNGEIHAIKDPIEQASRNHHALVDQLEKLPNWSDRNQNFGHAVCFPDTFLPTKERLKPDLPRELILDHNDLENIETSLPRLFQEVFGRRLSIGAPGPDLIQIIESYLARSFEITTPLGIDLEYEDEKLIQLTERQFFALSLLGDRKRAAIGGCAGSGKTMLAVRKAQQFADLGMKVLLTCFNAPLADDLRARLPNIEVYHFHGLCREAAKHVGIALKTFSSEAELFDIGLPEALLDAAQEIGRIYDAIIIDEGQDFQENYWIGLESLLKENGILYVFFDNNQNLYGGQEDFGGLITETPFTLTENCRNTKSIHKTVVQFHNNPYGLTCFGPQGRIPEKIAYDGEANMLRALQKLLHRLVKEERIDCEDIVILTPRGEERTNLKPGTKLGLFTLTRHLDRRPYLIQATSVHRFKGLERRVVILAEIDQHTPYNLDMVMYVGCSRARTHLVLLYDEDTPQEVISRL